MAFVNIAEMMRIKARKRTREIAGKERGNGQTKSTSPYFSVLLKSRSLPVSPLKRVIPQYK
jgi:hypothetical protein